MFQAFDDVGDHGVGLRALEAIEGLYCEEWKFGFDCNDGRTRVRVRIRV